MNSARSWALAFALFCSLAQACASDLKITVVFDHKGGLKPGDRVLMEEKAIGTVESMTVNPEGRFAAHLWIENEYRDQVTDRCRFYIRPDPETPENQSLYIVRDGEGGEPLEDGATLEGSSYLDDLLEQGGRGIQVWSERLQEEIDRWAKELGELPEKEWYKQLKRQMEKWAEDLEHAEEDTRRYFRDEVLPHLEESLEELKRRFEKKGKEEEVEPLEIRLKRLREI